MPKMNKEKQDEVIKYLKNGYTIKETTKKTGTSRGYVSKINKEIAQKTENTHQISKTSTLSEESIQILYNIQGLFGCKNLDETVSQLNEDIKTIMPRKYEFDFDFNKSISEVFEGVYKKHEEKKIIRKRYDNIIHAKNNDWIQRLILKIWEVDPAVFAFHNIACGLGFDGTIIDYMTTAAIKAFTERNWSVKYYWNEELKEKMPIIIDPRGNEFKFPYEDK